MNYRTHTKGTRWNAAQWLGIVFITATIVACAPAAEPAVPTRPPAPTFTPTTAIQAPGANVDPAVAAAAATAAAAEVAATQAVAESTQPPAEAAPTEAPTEAPTNTPVAAAEVVISSQVNVRGGPGTNYNIIGAANAGQRFPVTGKNNDGSWWQIDFNGQRGWVLGELVSAQNTQAVALAQDIPAPPPTNTPAPIPPTPVPQPTTPPEQPAEQPAEPTAAPAPPAQDFPFVLGDNAQCAPNAGNTYFSGYVRDSSNNLINGVCVHLAFYGPRGTKCSGCDGVGDGNWGFSPFGGPAPAGTQVEIYIVPCEGSMPMGGQTEQSGFGNLAQQSPKWTRTINSSEQCTGITFYKMR